MKLSEEKRATLQALSEYVELLLELSDSCAIKYSVYGSRWDWADKNSPPEKLANEFIEQLSYLPSQTARSQILILGGSSLTAMRVYYVNMIIQLLLQRDVLARQFKTLHQLQDGCQLIVYRLQEFCAKAKDGELPEAMKEVADAEQLESIAIKTNKRFKRIQDALGPFERKLNIYTDISLYLGRLSEDDQWHKGFFGVLDIPFNFREEVKVTEPLARALSLHNKYANDKINPDWEYPGYDNEWSMPLADECQEFQDHIKRMDQLITNCNDIPDIAALAKLVTKML